MVSSHRLGQYNAKYLRNWLRDFHEIFRVWGVIPRIPCAKYGGIWVPNFWGGGGKVEPLTPYLQNGRSRGLKIFLCNWGPLSTEKWNFSIRTLVKGGGRKNIFGFKNFSETSPQIFTKFSGFWGHPRIPYAKYGGIWWPNFWGGGGKVEPLNDALSLRALSWRHKLSADAAICITTRLQCMGLRIHPRWVCILMRIR